MASNDTPLRFSLADANELIFIMNQKNIIPKKPVCEFNPEIKNIQDYLLLDSNENVFPQEFISSFTAIVDVFNFTSLKNDTEYKTFYNYLWNTNTKNLSNIQTLFTSYKRDLNIKNETLANYVEFINNICECTRNNANTFTANTFNYMKNILHYMCIVFPEIIAHDVIDRLSNLGVHDIIPKHWNISNIHENNIVKYIYNFYGTIGELHQNGQIVKLIQKIQPKLRKIYELIHLIPFSTQQNSIFSLERVAKLMEYFFLQVMKLYINIDLGEIVTEDINQDSGVVEVDVVQVNEHEPMIILHKLTILSKYLEIIMPYKKIVCVSAETINAKILDSRETEKKKMTEKLRALDNIPDAMQVEKELKSNKLGKWGAGLSKGMTQYVKQDYDDDETQIIDTVDGLDGEAQINDGLNNALNDELNDELGISETDLIRSEESYLNDLNEANDISNLIDDDDVDDEQGDFDT